MARIPGERFDIDLDDPATATPRKHSSAVPSDTAALPGFIGDVQEREITADVLPPTLKTHTLGFPEHKKRTELSKFKLRSSGPEDDGNATSPAPRAPDISLSNPTPLTPSGQDESLFERHSIDAENKRTIASMSAAEIDQQRRELFAGLSPALIEKLLKRSNIDDESASAGVIDFDKPTRGRSSATRPTRPSTERRVSFALPEEKAGETGPASTASSHSITLSPAFGASASTPTSDISDNALSRSSSVTSVTSRQSSGSFTHDRKVSFVLPDYIELARKAEPTAVRHSVNSPMAIVSDKVEPVDTHEIPHVDLARTHSALRSPLSRPIDPDRRVAFALPESEFLLDRRASSAASHSIALSPILKASESPDPSVSISEKIDDIGASRGSDHNSAPEQESTSEHESALEHQHEREYDNEIDEGSIHFPKPPAVPDLDPNSPSFLEDLHEKYFPNLAHDPSKLAWMAPATAEENAAYDPERANLEPKDVRFDFKGKIIPPSKSIQIPTDVGLHHHGDAPSAAGYTIAELGHLARSAFPAQRCLAIQTAGRILYRLGKGEFGNENDVHVLGPDGERALLAKGLWDAVDAARVVDTITAEANRDQGHQTSIALAQEAVWNWRKGGGRQRKAV